MNMKEIKGFDGYFVNEKGQVFSNKYGDLKELKPGKGSNGYYTVALHKNGKQKSHYVHRLVAETFLGIQSETVNHKNGNKTDNVLENLEWMTKQEQQLHKRDVLDNSHTLPQPQRRKIAEMYKTGRYKQTELGAMFGIAQSLISKYVKEFS